MPSSARHKTLSEGHRFEAVSGLPFLSRVLMAVVLAICLSTAATISVNAQSVYAERAQQLMSFIDQAEADVASGKPLVVDGGEVARLLDVELLTERRPQSGNEEELSDLHMLGEEAERFTIMLLTEGTMDQATIVDGDYAAIGRHQNAYVLVSRFHLFTLANATQGRRTEIMSERGDPGDNQRLAEARDVLVPSLYELYEAALEEMVIDTFTPQTRTKLLDDLLQATSMLLLMNTPQEIAGIADNVARLSAAPNFPDDARDGATRVERWLRNLSNRPSFLRKSANADAFRQEVTHAVESYYQLPPSSAPAMTARFEIDRGGFVVGPVVVSPDVDDEKARSITRAILRAQPLPVPPDDMPGSPVDLELRFTD